MIELAIMKDVGKLDAMTSEIPDDHLFVVVLISQQHKILYYMLEQTPRIICAHANSLKLSRYTKFYFNKS